MMKIYSIDGVPYRSLADAENKAKELLFAGRKGVIIKQNGKNYSARYLNKDGTVGFVNLLYKGKSYE